MPAFEGAAALGYRWIETDAHVTADGICLAFHDDRLDRVTDRAGVIADLPVPGGAPSTRRGPGADPADGGPARRLPRPSGEHRPQARRRGRRPRRGHRAYGAVRSRLHRLVLRPAHRAVPSGRSDRAVHLPRASRRRPAAGRLDRLPAGSFDGACAQVPHRLKGVTLTDAKFVRRAHAAGLQVHVWTIDDPEEMHHLLDLGVDGIMTDRPGVCATCCAAAAPGTDPLNSPDEPPTGRPERSLAASLEGASMPSSSLPRARRASSVIAGCSLLLASCGLIGSDGEEQVASEGVALEAVESGLEEAGEPVRGGPARVRPRGGGQRQGLLPPRSRALHLGACRWPAPSTTR
jgi:glycerophosphoryl diester phosphodiesterase